MRIVRRQLQARQRFASRQTAAHADFQAEGSPEIRVRRRSLKDESVIVSDRHGRPPAIVERKFLPGDRLVLFLVINGIGDVVYVVVFDETAEDEPESDRGRGGKMDVVGRSDVNVDVDNVRTAHKTGPVDG